MRFETIKTIIRNFITSDKPEMLVLRGRWGTGKTFTWNSVLLENKDKINVKNYCYVSLFSVKDIAELRIVIYTKMRPKEAIGEKDWTKDLKESYRHLGKLLKNFNIPFLNVNNIVANFETLAPYLIKEALICLDDFERMPKNISHEELLGLITELKEEKNCKVALIFNENELSPDIYNKYREKLVDYDLLLALSAKEAAELAIPENLSYRESIIKYVILLDINNIRILQRIVNLAALMYGKILHLDPMVLEQTIMTLVVLTWCSYDSSENKPSLEFVKNWNRIVWQCKNEDDEKNVKKQEIVWGKVLSDYGLYNLDNLDQSILNVIKNGYLEESNFETEAQKQSTLFENGEFEKSFSEAWDMFHYSFEDNENDLIEALEISFKDAVHRMATINLDGTVTLLKQLGYNDKAAELIDYFVTNRSSDPEIFDLSLSSFANEIKDQDIIDRFRTEFLKREKPLSLVEAIKHIAENGVWSEKQVFAVENASEDDLYQLFKNYTEKDLKKIVKTCLRFPSQNGNIVQHNTRAALIRIGKENRLNALRVKQFGVEITEA